MPIKLTTIALWWSWHYLGSPTFKLHHTHLQQHDFHSLPHEFPPFESPQAHAAALRQHVCTVVAYILDHMAQDISGRFVGQGLLHFKKLFNLPKSTKKVLAFIKSHGQKHFS
jgi:hypothetical protein